MPRGMALMGQGIREGFQEEEAKAWKARRHQPGTALRLSQDTEPGRAGDRGVSNKGGVSQVLTLVVSVQLPSTATILTTSRSLPPLGKKTGTSLYKSLIFFLS